MKVEFSENGSSVERFLYPVGDSASFANSYLKGEGWDWVVNRGYQGFWANEKTLELCTYCEGDIVVMKSPSQAVFDQEHIELSSWYAENS